jgi:hypothetical protein
MAEPAALAKRVQSTRQLAGEAKNREQRLPRKMTMAASLIVTSQCSRTPSVPTAHELAATSATAKTNPDRAGHAGNQYAM